MKLPAPGIGRIVHYRLAEHDLATIRGYGGNPVKAGDVFPAVIVQNWGNTDSTTAAVQLKVLLDGPRDYWATSRHCDPFAESDGCWFWPPRT